MPPPPNLPAPRSREPLPTPRPAPSGCPVNRVISHPHLDSCESGPPHPSRLVPKDSPGLLSWTRVGRLGSQAPSLVAGLPQLLDAPVLALAILALARFLCSGPELHGQLLSSLVASSLRARSCSVALPMGTCSGYTGSRQPLPPLAPD